MKTLFKILVITVCLFSAHNAFARGSHNNGGNHNNNHYNPYNDSTVQWGVGITASPSGPALGVGAHSSGFNPAIINGGGQYYSPPGYGGYGYGYGGGYVPTCGWVYLSVPMYDHFETIRTWNCN